MERLLKTPRKMAIRMLKKQRVSYLLVGQYCKFNRRIPVDDMGVVLTEGLLKHGALEALKELLDKSVNYPNLKIVAAKKGIDALKFFKNRGVEDSDIFSIVTPSHHAIIEAIPDLSVKILFCPAKEVNILSSKSFKRIAKKVDAFANYFPAIEQCITALSP